MQEIEIEGVKEMARRRMIDPNFWQSEDISRLSPFARLLFIGMISHADDEGRGRANVNYLKSIVFPYDEIRAADVEKAISEICHNTSVTVYTVAHSSYYAFTNWEKWQRVDKPQKSIIPPPPTDSGTIPEPVENHSGTIPESVENDSGLKEEKRKEEKGKEEKGKKSSAGKPPARFVPPTVEEVAAYCRKRRNGIDPEAFVDYYQANGWIQGKGKPIKDWQACVRTWEKREKERSPSKEQAEQKEDWGLKDVIRC